MNFRRSNSDFFVGDKSAITDADIEQCLNQLRGEEGMSERENILRIFLEAACRDLIHAIDYSPGDDLGSAAKADAYVNIRSLLKQLEDLAKK